LAQKFVQERAGEPRGEGGKNGNAGTAQNSPEIDVGIGRTVAAGRQAKVGFAEKKFKGLIGLFNILRRSV
jgi:hypothetical protein